jgi:hypothetical protein
MMPRIFMQTTFPMGVMQQLDATAIHDNVANEISALAAKAAPVAGDIMIIEDSADSFNKKKVDVSSLGGGTASVIPADDATFDKFLDNYDESTEFLQDILETIDEQAKEIIQSDSEPGTTYPGLVWIDTDAGGGLDDTLHDNVAGEINAITSKATPVDADVLIIEDSAASWAKKKIAVSTIAAPVQDGDDIGTELVGDEIELMDRFIIMTNTQSAGVGGGGTTSGSWGTCTLNTEDHDPNGWCSLSSNAFTLAAGTYRINARMTLHASSYSQIRLRNTTAGTTIQQGNVGYGNPAQSTDSPMRLMDVFTIAASQALEIQYRVASSKASYGQGIRYSGGSGEVEKHLQVMLERIK